MAYYPIAIDLTNKKVLVVGGGAVALRKVETLLEFGALVAVVAPEVEPEIAALAQSGKITLERRSYSSDDLNNAVIAIAATDDREVNVRVSEDAKSMNIPVNIVDVPELCTFIVPATVKRGDLTISISTAGKSPALARMVREKIEEVIGPEYGELAEIMGDMRELAKEQIETQPEREKVLKRILNSEVIDLLCAGRREDACALAVELFQVDSTKKM